MWFTASLVFATAAALAGVTTDILDTGRVRVEFDGPQGGVGQTREARLSARRAEAKALMDAERELFWAGEIDDIETLYRSAHENSLGFVRGPEGQAILRTLVEKYPRSNRAGCAAFELARIASGSERVRQLRVTITQHSRARFENGVQVGAIARAMLAVHLAGAGQFAEAERLANEVNNMFPGAIDDTGASLDGLAESIRLLR